MNLHQSVKLGNFIEISSGDSPSKYKLDASGLYPFVKVEDLNNCGKYQTSSRFYTNDKFGLVPKDTIIFPKRGAAILNNKMRLAANPLCMDTNMMGIIVRKGFDPEYLFYLLFYLKLYKIADTSTIPQLNNKHILPLKIRLIPLSEQKRIATILSTWDQALEQLRALIGQKETQLRGLMQRLLKGEVRLPGFEGDWTKATLGSIGTFYKGKGISKSQKSVDGRTPCVLYGELYTIYGPVIKEVISRTDLEQDELFISEIGDVILPASGETRLDIATASCIMQANVALGSDLNVFRSSIFGPFLSYHLNEAGKRQIVGLAQGSSVIHLYRSQLQKVIIQFPDTSEQRAIVEVLNTASEEIRLLNERLELLEEEKRGLMQRLFG